MPRTCGNAPSDQNADRRCMVLSLRGSNTPGRSLDNNWPGHMRMQGAKVLVAARRRECERELVVGIERRRFKGLRGGSHRVGNVVVVAPHHGGTSLHRNLRRGTGEVGNLDRNVSGPRWSHRQTREEDGGG